MPRPEIGFYRGNYSTGERYRVVYNPKGRGVVIHYREKRGEKMKYSRRVFRTIREGGEYLRSLMLKKGILKY